MGNPLSVNQPRGYNPFASPPGNDINADEPGGLISTMVGGPATGASPSTGLILGGSAMNADRNLSKLEKPTVPGTILGGQMYDPTKPAPGPVSEAVTNPVTPVTPPGYMQGETKEQRRARIEKNRRAKGEIA